MYKKEKSVTMRNTNIVKVSEFGDLQINLRIEFIMFERRIFCLSEM